RPHPDRPRFRFRGAPRAPPERVDMTVVANTRILRSPLTGVQRYATELLARLPEVEGVAPAEWVTAAAGHLWEQTMLPLKINGDLLWSPAGAGPISVARQVVTVHDLATIDCAEDYAPAYRAYYQWLLPRLLPRVAGILTVSEFSRQRIVSHFGVGEDRVHAV